MRRLLALQVLDDRAEVGLDRAEIDAATVGRIIERDHESSSAKENHRVGLHQLLRSCTL